MANARDRNPNKPPNKDRRDQRDVLLNLTIIASTIQPSETSSLEVPVMAKSAFAARITSVARATFSWTRTVAMLGAAVDSSTSLLDKQPFRVVNVSSHTVGDVAARPGAYQPLNNAATPTCAVAIQPTVGFEPRQSKPA